MHALACALPTKIAKKRLNLTNPDFLLPGIGQYLFVKTIGTGKFSKVKLARHCDNGKEFAVKIIDKRAHDHRVLSRLVREISLMEQLNHENVVKLEEVVDTPNSLFLVLEYVPGCNLDEYLQKRGGSLSEEEARDIFRQMVTAISYCHSRWICHRDLKTPNILIGPGGVVKVADFGLGNRFGLQRLRTICGSMLYYSPEIISGQKYRGPEVDCWCLGVALFRMTAGYEPFCHASTVGELKIDVCTGNYRIPDKLSLELQSTIKKCLSLDRKRRMNLKSVLGGDPWLNDFGRIGDPAMEDAGNGRDSNMRRASTDLKVPCIKRTFIHSSPESPSFFPFVDASQEDAERAALQDIVRQQTENSGLSLLQTTTHFRLHLRSFFNMNRVGNSISRRTKILGEFIGLPQLVTRDYLCFFTISGGKYENQDVTRRTEMLRALTCSCELVGVTYVIVSPHRVICTSTLTNNDTSPTWHGEYAASATSVSSSLKTSKSTKSLSTKSTSPSTTPPPPPITSSNKGITLVNERTAMFYIEIFTTSQHAKVVGLRFSKVRGTGQVFRVAVSRIMDTLALSGPDTIDTKDALSAFEESTGIDGAIL
ncbi:kinase-like domain-containing protein [Jimgerdemannia flammicorona]|uniref:Kinase-like domain-containing protein n=1 Tax=Jimgerdemannia flammicorona TaxID=994334 RepID=A0A433A2K0_9FUNG|nr:kinase-like domain-containing protein [Jimgerdemannia flammicorona]